MKVEPFPTDGDSVYSVPSNRVRCCMPGHSSPLPSFASQPAAPTLAAGGAGTRVDDAHPKRNGRRGTQRTLHRSTNVATDPAAEGFGIQREDSQLEDWLRLHAADLVAQLQQAAESLDAREARLNAQIATHERREREFRLWSESQRNELDELRDEAERLRTELKTAARRVALTDQAPLQG